MRVNLSYELPEDSDKTPQWLTNNYIEHAVNQKYKEGLNGQMRRIYSRIQRKFDIAIKERAESVDLEEAEKDFIKGLFNDDVKFPPQTAKFVLVLEEEVAKL